ncbi:ribonuclease [Bacillus sp. AFS002410]|uniref:YlzJ-like family protein n=1 Tax=Bacillus sp. AFS002410 TaxID=2033481 RepID=UPI000BF05A2A|nr:YlzJ-like family protein [Bacillus sp. AFS002410]PEJ60196.1 ribonuclease [Bacillus sp. AFS002410]
MILYTIMPLESIYPVDQKEYASQQFMEYNGVPMLVDSVGGTAFEIRRIVSTDPEHYMQYSPGQRILVFPS